MRDYDELCLKDDHLAVLPNGRAFQLPAGTKLIMANVSHFERDTKADPKAKA
jgi:hypothetical protein